LRAYTLGFAVPHHDTEHTECPNCEGGGNHSALLAAATRIERQKPGIDLLLEGGRGPAPALNVLQPATGCRSGGCNACSAVHA
jgi:hypothetical protein